jgi:Flp pilus assembly protein TadD
MTGKLKKSLNMIEKAINFAPKNAELYIQKGKVLELSGDKDLAKQSYLKAISIGDDYIIETAENAILGL